MLFLEENIQNFIKLEEDIKDLSQAERDNLIISFENRIDITFKYILELEENTREFNSFRNHLKENNIKTPDNLKINSLEELDELILFIKKIDSLYNLEKHSLLQLLKKSFEYNKIFIIKFKEIYGSDSKKYLSNLSNIISKLN